MISQETKDQIEEEAKKWSRSVMGIELDSLHETPREVEAYTVAATKYAEKLEEKDKEIEKLTEDSRLWKIAHDNCANHFDDLKKQLESKDRETDLLTKDIKDQGEYLKQMIEINVLNDAFNSGEEWRKSHKVKEGEQFTDYFMRVFEVEKEDRDRELAQLKEEYQTFKAGIAKGDELYANLSWDGELSPHQKLKEIAEKMSYALQEAIDRQFGNTIDWNKGKQALTAYAEWRKQNLK